MVKETKFQVRVLFTESGRLGMFSFYTWNDAFAAFADVLASWDTFSKVAVMTVNGISVIDTSEIALVSVMRLS